MSCSLFLPISPAPDSSPRALHPLQGCPVCPVLSCCWDGAKSAGINSAESPGDGSRLVQLSQLAVLEEAGRVSGVSAPHGHCSPCTGCPWPCLCSHGKGEGSHQPFLMHGGQILCSSRDRPCSYCLSLQSYLRFWGELSKQSEGIDGKDACVPLASFCRGRLISRVHGLAGSKSKAM